MHTHTFNGPFSGTTQVSRYQKGKTNLDYTEARDSEWQWHQLGHMQVCTLLQTDNHTSTPSLFFTGQMPFLPPNQQRQSTEGSDATGWCNTEIFISVQPCISHRKKPLVSAKVWVDKSLKKVKTSVRWTATNLPSGIWRLNSKYGSDFPMKSCKNHIQFKQCHLTS